MKLTLDSNTAQYNIENYQPGIIKISGNLYHQSILLMPEQLLPWEIHAPQKLCSAALSLLLEFQVDIILLGTGNKLIFPSSKDTSIIYQAGIGLEIMDTAAACRTYTILVSEQRSVLAGLIIEQPS